MCFQCPFCSFVIKYVSQNKLGSEVVCPNCGKSNVLPHNPYGPGRVIGGDFVIKHEVGVGSIGVVYEAWQVSLERPVALKILNAKYTNTKGISAFLYEARAAASLDHINIVKCFAVGEEKGVCYMAMSFIHGETLKNRLKREGKFQPDEALHVIQQVAESLHYAWEAAKLIHRDIKPENIMIDKEGIVKVTDLGLALKQSDWDEDMEISGSPSYMSPEQFSGGQIDSRADIYSLGVSLYQLIAGKLPFEAETMRSLARKHFREPPPQLYKNDSNVPQAISALVDKMMAKSPDDRFQTMEELLKGIWDIRQKTAPDADMVPGVHTITIKKLDYDLQKDAIVKKKDLKRDTVRRETLASSLPVAMGASSGLVIFLVALSSILFVTLLAVLVFRLRDESALKGMDWEMRKIETKIEDRNQDPLSIEVECGKTSLLLKSLPESPGARELWARLNLCMAKIEKARLLKEKEKLVADQEKLQKSQESLKKEIDAKLMENARLLKENDELKVTTIQKENKLKDTLEKELSKKQELTEKVKEKEVELKKVVDVAAADNEFQDASVFKIYQLIKQGHGKKVGDVLDVYSRALSPPLRKNLLARRASFEQLHQVYAKIIEVSNSLDVLKADIEEGKIVRLSGNGVFIVQKFKAEGKDKESGGSTKSGITLPAEITWDRLSVKSLFNIVKGAFPEDPPKLLKIKIALLTGELAQVSEELSGCHDYDFLVDAIITSAIENLKVTALMDRKKAIPQAQSVLKQFNNVPGFRPFEAEVKALTSFDTAAPLPVPVDLETR